MQTYKERSVFFLSAVFEFEVLFPKFVPPSELVSDSFVFNIANTKV